MFPVPKKDTMLNVKKVKARMKSFKFIIFLCFGREKTFTSSKYSIKSQQNIATVKQVKNKASYVKLNSWYIDIIARFKAVSLPSSSLSLKKAMGNADINIIHENTCADPV